MKGKIGLLTGEKKELLERAANLMDELLETLKVMQDSRLAEDLKGLCGRHRHLNV